jgi:hypothetical protein
MLVAHFHADHFLGDSKADEVIQGDSFPFSQTAGLGSERR